MRSAAAIGALLGLLLAPTPLSAAPASLRVLVEVGADGPALFGVEASDRMPPVSASRGSLVWSWEGPDGATGTLRTVDPRRRHVDSVQDERWTGGEARLESALLPLPLPLEALGGRLTLLGADAPPLRLPEVLPERPPRGGEESRVFTVQDSGPPELRPDVVFLAEGYTADREARFVQDIDAVLAYLEVLEPWSRYLPLLNVHGVFTPSAEAGADHPERDPPVQVDTPMNCRYGVAGLDRLVDCTEARVLALSGLAPGEDIRIVLVDDPAYGASGGAVFAVSYNGEEMVRVLAHEVAHSDAALADEYVYETPYGDPLAEFANCAREEDELPWQGWIDGGAAGVDAWLGCTWPDRWRPTDNACLMRSLQDRYCVACREAISLSLLGHLGGLIEDQQPASDEPLVLPALGTGALSATAVPLAGEPLLATWRWLERDRVLAEGPGLLELELEALDLSPGVQTVELVVQDTVPWVLEDVFGLRRDRTTFFVDVSPTGGDDDDDGGSGCEDPGCEDPGCGGDGCGAGGSAALLPLLLPVLSRRRRG